MSKLTNKLGNRVVQTPRGPDQSKAKKPKSNLRAILEPKKAAKPVKTTQIKKKVESKPANADKKLETMENYDWLLDSPKIETTVEVPLKSNKGKKKTQKLPESSDKSEVSLSLGESPSMVPAKGLLKDTSIPHPGQYRTKEVGFKKAINIFGSDLDMSDDSDKLDKGERKSDSLSIKSKSQHSNEEKVSSTSISRRPSKQTEAFNSKLNEINNNRTIIKKVNLLRYRENVFRAASRLAKEMPPYPDWVYQDEEIQYLDVTQVNVGGVIFHMFDDTLSMLKLTKLAKCIKDHTTESTPFFDRDPVCFNSIANFYRTGRLHVPPNTCLTLFEEELEFWGVKEEFMETCCWSDYQTFKTATITLKKYVDDIRKEQYDDESSTGRFFEFKSGLYKVLTVGQGSILARWFALVCGISIVLSIMGMIISCTEYGRTSINDDSVATLGPNQKVSDFFTDTKLTWTMKTLEYIISGFFLSELVGRFFLCPSKLEFFSDSLNWIDLVATSTSLTSTTFTQDNSLGNFEGYMLILKLPRIFRLFRLTLTLRSGMEAFTLTIMASATELKLVFMILFIIATLFGSLMFLIETLDQTSEQSNEESAISNIFIGMWWALVTMSAVGYGEYKPVTFAGYLVGSVTIVCGVIICQLPVPIVLKNFTVYFSQAHARMNKRSKLIVKVEDPESSTTDNSKIGLDSLKKEGAKKFRKLFNTLR